MSRGALALGSPAIVQPLIRTNDNAMTASALSTAAIFLLGAWLTTRPAGRLVARVLRKKTEQIEQLPTADGVLRQEQRGFVDGGAAIGRLERLLIYLFVMSDQAGAVGFLIAAKSVFRFGELSQQQHRLEAEYITIGTLLSFVVGFAIAMATRYLMGGVPYFLQFFS